MSTVAVFGGTGFIGREVVRRALTSAPGASPLGNAKIVVASRSLPSDYPFAGRVEFRPADVTRPDTLAPALEGVETVIQALSFPTAPIEIPRRGWTYLHVDGQGSENLVRAARAAGVKRYLYVSGAGAGEMRRENWFRAKDMAEAAVRANFPNDFTILRPSWIYGPGDRSMNKFLFFAKYLPFFPVFGDGMNKIQPVFVEDVAKAILAAVASPAARTKTYGLGGPETLTMRQIAETIFRVTNDRPILGILPHPIPLMKIPAFFAEFLPVPPLSRGMIDFVTMEAQVSLDAARADLGFDPVPLAEGLRRYVPHTSRV